MPQLFRDEDLASKLRERFRKSALGVQPPDTLDEGTGLLKPSRPTWPARAAAPAPASFQIASAWLVDRELCKWLLESVGFVERGIRTSANELHRTWPADAALSPSDEGESTLHIDYRWAGPGPIPAGVLDALGGLHRATLDFIARDKENRKCVDAEVVYELVNRIDEARRGNGTPG